MARYFPEIVAAAKAHLPERCVVDGEVLDLMKEAGCVAIGYTIYPGTLERRLQYEQLQQLTLDAKQAGLAVVVWAARHPKVDRRGA